jgi:hypothetical protein
LWLLLPHRACRGFRGPCADERRRNQRGVQRQSLLTNAVRESLDLDFFWLRDSRGKHQRQQAASNPGDLLIDRRIRAGFHAGARDHAWRGQPRLPKDVGKLEPGSVTNARSGEGVPDPLDGDFERRTVGCRGRAAHIHLLENHDTRRFHERRQPAQYHRGIGEVHEDEAADEGIDGVVQCQICGVLRQKAHIGQTGVGGATGGERHRFGRRIDPNDCSSWPHDPGREKRHISRAAAHIQDAHPLLESSQPQHRCGQIVKELGLTNEALQLIIRMAQGV